MVQCGDMLYIRTSHKMYQNPSDGLNHQANLTFCVQISTMEVTDRHTAVSRFGFGYVSHSFNQFLALRGTTLLAADHGDAYPRAVVLSRCARPGGEKTFSGYADMVEVLPICGETGDNRTGLSLGGLAATSSAYLVAGCSVAQNEESAFGGVRNIFVTSTPAQNFTQSATELRWITSFEDSQPAGASNPYLVKLGEVRLLLLWEAQEELQFGFLDGSGKLVGDIYHGSGRIARLSAGNIGGLCLVVLHRQKRAGVLPAGPQNRWTGVPERVRFCNSGPKRRHSQPFHGVRHVWRILWSPAGSGSPGLRLCRLVPGPRRARSCRVTEDTQVTIGRDHTLYAQWTPAPHTHDYKADVTPPSCTEEGYTTYTCTLCGHSYRDTYTPALGHSLGPAVCKQEPTCTEPGLQERACIRCGHSQPETIAPLGHAYDQGIVTQEPTCTSPGTTVYTCTRCGIRETQAISPLPHQYGELVTPPTCTEEGYTTHTCSVCGNSYVDCYVNPRGHSWDKGRVTTPPTPAKPGVKTYVCTRCNENRTESIGPWPNPFVDVEEGRYYYTPVLWAVYAGVASGIDRTHFMPEQTCTRGQVVTFLWRAKGCPAPESAQCPFLDVTPKRYYYDAVLWAAEQGITAGVDATHFNPEGVVTRGQLVTFLWRAGGCPAVSGRNPFVDVTQDRFYYDAVLWAAARGITLGIDATHFMPNRSCTRGQVATFLFRESEG